MRNQENITQHLLLTLLDYNKDTGVFRWNKLETIAAKSRGKIAGTINSSGYLMIGINKRQYLAHRLVWVYMYGVWPKDQIDHINRVRSDNRLSNLRPIDHIGNCHNVSLLKANKSGRTGVHYDKNRKKWIAKIKYNNKEKWLGSFDIKERAIAARIAGEAIYHPTKPLCA